MLIEVENRLQMAIVSPAYSQAIFDLASANRSYLENWLPWVDQMQSVAFIEQFIANSQEKNQLGMEFAFVILLDSQVVGRIGVYQIDQYHRTGEIGYWIGSEFAGYGIVSRCVVSLLDFCFRHLNLNRIEIRCTSDNLKSRKVPERIQFRHEGVLRQGARTRTGFADLELYALLAADWQRMTTGI
jgi:ribosomal-protein-serine acetyltransferase